MALKTRKSMLGDLRKMFSNEKLSDIPPKDPVDIPVNALCISRYGLVQNQQLTFYRKTDKKFLIDDNHYYVPRCMQPPGSTELEPTIRRFTWLFDEEFASESTPAKQESFMGAYSIWYKETGTLDNPKTLSEIRGDFWMLRHANSDLAPGDTVEWAHVPGDMVSELNNDWWFMSVQLPDIEAVSRERAAEMAAMRAGPSGPLS